MQSESKKVYIPVEESMNHVRGRTSLVCIVRAGTLFMSVIHCCFPPLSIVPVHILYKYLINILYKYLINK